MRFNVQVKLFHTNIKYLLILSSYFISFARSKMVFKRALCDVMKGTSFGPSHPQVKNEAFFFCLLVAVNTGLTRRYLLDPVPAVSHVVLPDGAMPTTFSTLLGLLAGCWVVNFSCEYQKLVLHRRDEVTGRKEINENVESVQLHSITAFLQKLKPYF